MNLHRVPGLLERTDVAFRAELLALAKRLSADPTAIAAVISYVTSGTFSAALKRPGPMIGLLVFTEPVARWLGTSLAELAQMSARSQLRFVEAYFKKFRPWLRTPEDYYLAVVWPSGVGMRLDDVLFSATNQHYPAMQDLDVDRRGGVSKREYCGRFRRMYDKAVDSGPGWEVSGVSGVLSVHTSEDVGRFMASIDLAAERLDEQIRAYTAARTVPIVSPVFIGAWYTWLHASPVEVPSRGWKPWLTEHLGGWSRFWGTDELWQACEGWQRALIAQRAEFARQSGTEPDPIVPGPGFEAEKPLGASDIRFFGNALLLVAGIGATAWLLSQAGMFRGHR